MINPKSGDARPFWSYAFRPFFLLNGLFAMVVISLWIMALHGAGPAGLPADIMGWHGHEMLVGFAMAAIAGFVLTAVATWTGRPPVAGAPLGLLVAAWLVGRCAMLFAGVLPVWLTIVLDLAFPVLLCVLVGREVIGAGNRRNYPIVGLTALLAILNLVYHLGPGRLGLYLLIHTILLMITVIAGRIVPSFTANWMRAQGITRLPTINTPVNNVAILATVATGISTAVAPMSDVTGVLAMAAAIAHGIRLMRWRGLSTASEPLLLMLHVAYLWLPVGYLLTGLAVFGLWFLPTAALHALTMGAIGSMILAVTTRVALAHTGRKLHAARATVVAYCLLTLAVVVRVLSSFGGGAYLDLVDLSALGWIATFAIFTWVYWPILRGPRVD